MCEQSNIFLCKLLGEEVVSKKFQMFIAVTQTGHWRCSHKGRTLKAVDTIGIIAQNNDQHKTSIGNE